MFLPSYIAFWSAIFEILCGQTHRQIHRRRQYLPAACAQVITLRQTQKKHKPDLVVFLYTTSGQEKERSPQGAVRSENRQEPLL